MKRIILSAKHSVKRCVRSYIKTVGFHIPVDRSNIISSRLNFEDTNKAYFSRMDFSNRTDVGTNDASKPTSKLIDEVSKATNPIEMAINSKINNGLNVHHLVVLNESYKVCKFFIYVWFLISFFPISPYLLSNNDVLYISYHTQHNVPPGSESHFNILVVSDDFDGKYLSN